MTKVQPTKTAPSNDDRNSASGLRCPSGCAAVPQKRPAALRARFAVVARLFVLLGTSYFLIATSRVDPPYRNQCSHGEIATRFLVTGNCGPEGEILVVSPAHECAISVQGAAHVGLPSAGRFTADDSVGLVGNAWSLSGYLPEGAATAPPRPDGGFFTVERDAGAAGASGTVAHGNLVVRTCRASTDSSRAITLDCRDGSIDACQASLVAR